MRLNAASPPVPGPIRATTTPAAVPFQRDTPATGAAGSPYARTPSGRRYAERP